MITLALALAGCGGSSRKTPLGPRIASIGGEWSGKPTSVAGDVVVHMANTSYRPVTFTLEDRWEQVDEGEEHPFEEEPMRLAPGAHGRVPSDDPDVLEVGPVQPGDSAWTTTIVTSAGAWGA